jgi:glycerol-3-phosphate dehydrogenase (NAD+)
MLSSCGVADLVASSFGGRNRKCSEEFVSQTLTGSASPSWEDIEARLLDGQRLQGLGTCDEVVACLDSLSLDSNDFPLFRKVHAIARSEAAPHSLFDDW